MTAATPATNDTKQEASVLFNTEPTVLRACDWGHDPQYTQIA